MSVRHVIEHALRSYYANSAEPNAIARDLLASHRSEALIEGAVELERIADETEARVAEHYGSVSGIGPGSAELVREAARTLRAMAGEKATAREAATATPHVFIEDARLRALHDAMTAKRGEWRSGDVRRVLRDAGFRGLGRNSASQFLRALVEKGLATAHGPQDGRFYTLSTTGKDGRA